MDRKKRVAAVSYLNTKPLVYGFEKGLMKDSIKLSFEYPSKVAEKLVSGEADIGLVPVAAIPLLNKHFIISDYCIGTEGEVASVCLFSDVPVREIKKVYLDYQSRTSVALLKILLRNHWKTDPELVQANKGYEAEIKGSTAGLVIGDRAFLQRKKSEFIYDLGSAWKEMSGLPFVFAAWVANKKLSDEFVNTFNAATGDGLLHINEIVEKYRFEDYDLHKYYTSDISYSFDENKRKGLSYFLNLLSY